MNGNYYKSDFLDNNIVNDNGIIDVLKLNIGKKVRLNVTIPGSKESQDRVFEGIIEKVGNDYLIVSNPTNGEWYFILPVYLGFITFDEQINYR